MTLRPQIKVNNESDRLYLEMLYDNYKNLMFKTSPEILSEPIRCRGCRSAILRKINHASSDFKEN